MVRYGGDFMKKTILMAVLIACSAVHALADDTGKKVQLYDGKWVLIQGDNVKLSRDGGKTWKPAPDGTWDAKDGSRMSTHNGKIVR